jgi:hypothetical protein
VSDWREINAHEYEDGYGYRLFHDDSYDASDYERGFKIYATTGASKYIPVDVSISAADADEENRVQDLLRAAKAHVPLYLLAHGSVSVSTNPFHDPYDSGQCGFAVLEQDSPVDGDMAMMELVLEQMVNEYDHLLRGNVIAWQVTKRNVCGSCNNSSVDIIDSCGGYIGFDFKELDSLTNEIIDVINRHREAEHASKSTRNSDD